MNNICSQFICMYIHICNINQPHSLSVLEISEDTTLHQADGTVKSVRIAMVRAAHAPQSPNSADLTPKTSPSSQTLGIPTWSSRVCCIWSCKYADFIRPSICPSIYLSIYLSVYLCTYLPTYPSIYPSV